MRIGFALNGVVTQDFRLTMPLTNPAGIFRGSYTDALAGAKQLAAKLGDNAVLALNMAQPGEWLAMQLTVDPAVARVIDNGVGHGGIASASFPSVSRSLTALVTANNFLEPHTFNGQPA
jgi:hypothetical protein